MARRPALLCHLAALTLLGACAHPPVKEGKAPPPATVTLSVVTTTDVHGHVEPTPFTVRDVAGAVQTVDRGGLPLLAGYVSNLRKSRPVVLLDAGDLFQGTMTSNLGEGQAVIDAFNLMGYAASAIGNHEFDYGPVGPAAVPREGSDADPTGALKARIAAARFPFLAANIIDEATGKPIAWPNTAPSLLYPVPQVPGLTIGIVGATTTDTPRTTNRKNLKGLRFDPIAPAVREQALRLRAAGAAAVVLTVHEGGSCKSFADPRDLSSCQGEDGKVLALARELAGAVDVIVAGHSHAGVAHFVGPVAVVQAYSWARYLGRVDLAFTRGASGGFTLDAAATRILPPQEVCGAQPVDPAAALARVRERRGRGPRPENGGPPGGGAADPASRSPDRPELLCDAEALSGVAVAPARYQDLPVTPDAAVAAAIAPHSQRAQALRQTPLGLVARDKVPRNYRAESPLGAMLADLLREGSARAARQEIAVAFQNGGGIRNQLPAGPLTYGDLYEVLPFDNQLVVARIPGALLVELYRKNLQSGAGVLIPSGITVDARCEGAELQVTLRDPAGKPLQADKPYAVAISDFLASGGDNFAAIMQRLPPGAVQSYEDLPPLRELVVEALKHHRELPVPAPGSPPRLRLPMPRPVRCGAPGATPATAAE